jgi:hypothetical protein
VGPREKRLPCNIDEDCAAVETNIPPKKKKTEEVGSTFKCKYSGKGKQDSDVLNDKWGLTLKQNGWGKGGKRWTKNWLEHEQAYKELMCMTGQKLQLQILQGRTGGAAEPVHVEDDRVENENQDDGARTLNCGGGGGKDIELCDGHGDSGGGRGGGGHDDRMQDDIHDEDEFLEDNGCGQEEEEEEEEEDQHPFQEDHVDVTNWLDLLNRSITPPLPRES